MCYILYNCEFIRIIASQIGFKEFYNFIAWEVVAGNDVITSEIKLPSGLGLPLGSMIEMLRRKRVMAEIERVGLSIIWACGSEKWLASCFLVIVHYKVYFMS